MGRPIHSLQELARSKTKNKREIPINEDLAQVFKEIRREQGLTSKHVFNYNGSTIKRIDRAFNATLKRVGIEDITLHDCRHTFASHLVMRGASLKEVQELLGHKTMTMTLRYAHLSQEHKKRAINLLNGLTASPQGPTARDCHNTVTSSISSVSARM